MMSGRRASVEWHELSPSARLYRAEAAAVCRTGCVCVCTCDENWNLSLRKELGFAATSEHDRAVAAGHSTVTGLTDGAERPASNSRCSSSLACGVLREVNQASKDSV